MTVPSRRSRALLPRSGVWPLSEPERPFRGLAGRGEGHLEVEGRGDDGGASPRNGPNTSSRFGTPFSTTRSPRTRTVKRVSEVFSPITKARSGSLREGDSGGGC